MDNNNDNVHEFPTAKSSPQNVVEMIQEILPEIEVMACVIRLKEDKTVTIGSQMNAQDMVWLRYCFEENFKP